VPMHYATGNTSGLGYVISFSTGALGEQAMILSSIIVEGLCTVLTAPSSILMILKVVNILLWIIRLVCNLCTLKSGKDAYNSLPSFHFRVMVSVCPLTCVAPPQVKNNLLSCTTQNFSGFPAQLRELYGALETSVLLSLSTISVKG
jgi:hypothetical protein